jgi:hypothetical protein
MVETMWEGAGGVLNREDQVICLGETRRLRPPRGQGCRFHTGIRLFDRKEVNGLDGIFDGTKTDW